LSFFDKLKIKVIIMKKQKALDLLRPLLNKPYFTAKEVRKLGISIATIHHYIKLGAIKFVRRGVYQNAKSENSSWQWTDLIEATLGVSGGIICLVSALAIYELTDEIPRQHWIAVSNSTSVTKSRSIRYVRMRNMKLGSITINLEGVEVPIFDQERTIVDSFRLLSKEIAIKALKFGLSKKGSQRLNLIKLQDYAKSLRVDITDFLLTATT
jgi:predicted transcriptional regulator of viral defense system